MLQIAISLIALNFALPHVLSSGQENRYELVWSEEFDGDKIDARSWTAEVNPGVTYGSDERQFYTDRTENLAVHNGKLVLRARAEEFDICEFTSARLNTYAKHDFLYGKIEARVRVASADGVRCKLSLLPSALTYGAWSRSGQIDVLESAGAKPAAIKGGLFAGGQGHYSVYQGGEYSPGDVDFSSGFHTYTVEWQPYEIRWFVDGELYAMQGRWSSFSADFPAPFDQSFFLTLSMAVEDGANAALLPAEMSVDWIRVHQIRGDHQPPVIELTSPTQDSTHGAGPLEITVRASDPDGDLQQVEFYNHQALLGVVKSAPYTFVWEAPDGCHQLTARAVDAAGFGRSARVEFVSGIGCPPQPFHGSPASLPGRVELEDFDDSPKERAYFDIDEENHGGSYRQTAVDLQECSEGGYNLSYIYAGEWLDFTVDVTKAGEYDIVCRTGTPWDSGQFRIEFGGVNKTGTLKAINTGDWQNYTNVIRKNVALEAGVQRMRVFIEEGGFNFNFIEVNASR